MRQKKQADEEEVGKETNTKNRSSKSQKDKSWIQYKYKWRCI